MPTRKEFITMMAAGGAAAAATAQGAEPRRTETAGAPMRNFRCAPIARAIRVGVVGTGARGSGAVARLLSVPGVEIVAICDIRSAYAEAAAKTVFKKTGRAPKVFSGTAESYRRICDLLDVDVVYNCTAWSAHVPVALAALKAGKHSFIEVPAALRVEDCWALVETAEETKLHCMMLENCVYGEEELLALNLCKLGLLGELVHGEGGYLHDRRWAVFHDAQWERWRNHWNEVHQGNQYPTHGLGPIALDMGINRGDRFDYLVSVDGAQRGYEAFAAQTLAKDDPGRRQKFAMADMNVTTIRTAQGRTIMLQHDVSSPRPYSRLNLIAGTKGVFRAYPQLQISLEGKNEWTRSHSFNAEKAAEIRSRCMHPLFKQVGELAKKMGGHGGMDSLMDLRWVYCLRNGLPLDMDVYDLASWCAVCELSERSARNRSRPEDFPDFTRGAWKRQANCNLMDATIDLAKLNG